MRRLFYWTLGLAGLAVAALVAPIPQRTVEGLYSGLIYPRLQRVTTSLSNRVPFALFDLLIIGLPGLWLAFVLRDLVRTDRRLLTLWHWFARTVTAGAVLYLVFLAMWGLNYRRVPLQRKLQYQPARVTTGAARVAADLSVERLNTLFTAAHLAGGVTNFETHSELASAFANTMQSLGASAGTVPGRPKRSILDFYFRPAAVAGMTDPYFLETLVESDLLPVERPFVVAHEWSHLAGFADEGEANFAGWLACTRADAPAQYSGWLFLFGELVSVLPRSERTAVLTGLGEGPRGDLRAIAARLTRDVKPRVSEAGWRVYDRFLKANRVEAGAASYAQVVRLVLGTGLGLSAAEAASPER